VPLDKVELDVVIGLLDVVGGTIVEPTCEVEEADVEELVELKGGRTGVDELDTVGEVRGPLEEGGVDSEEEDTGGGRPYEDEYNGGRLEVRAEDDGVALFDEAVDGALDEICVVETAEVLFAEVFVRLENVEEEEEDGTGNEVAGTVMVAVDVVPMCVVLGIVAVGLLDEVVEHVAAQL